MPINNHRWREVLTIGGACSRRKSFKIRCPEIASEAIFVLQFILGLDAGPKYFFWSSARHVQGSLSHHCTCSSDGYGQKGHHTRQFEGRGTKRQILTKGGYVPLVPPPSSAAYDNRLMLDTSWVSIIS